MIKVTLLLNFKFTEALVNSYLWEDFLSPIVNSYKCIWFKFEEVEDDAQ